MFNEDLKEIELNLLYKRLVKTRFRILILQEKQEEEKNKRLNKILKRNTNIINCIDYASNFEDDTMKEKIKIQFKKSQQLSFTCIKEWNNDITCIYFNDNNKERIALICEEYIELLNKEDITIKKNNLKMFFSLLEEIVKCCMNYHNLFIDILQNIKQKIPKAKQEIYLKSPASEDNCNLNHGISECIFKISRNDWEIIGEELHEDEANYKDVQIDSSCGPHGCILSFNLVEMYDNTEEIFKKKKPSIENFKEIENRDFIDFLINKID